MNKRLNSRSDHFQVTATNLGPRPGDYPPGSLQSRAAARALLEGADQTATGELTPLQQAMAEGEPYPEVREILVDLVRGAEERAFIFGHELPTPEWVRYRRVVIQKADEISGGHASEVRFSNGVEWNNWLRLAEEKLRDQGIYRPEIPAPPSWESVFRESVTTA